MDSDNIFPRVAEYLGWNCSAKVLVRHIVAEDCPAVPKHVAQYNELRHLSRADRLRAAVRLGYVDLLKHMHNPYRCKITPSFTIDETEVILRELPRSSCAAAVLHLFRGREDVLYVAMFNLGLKRAIRAVEMFIEHDVFPYDSLALLGALHMSYKYRLGRERVSFRNFAILLKKIKVYIDCPNEDIEYYLSLGDVSTTNLVQYLISHA